MTENEIDKITGEVIIRLKKSGLILKSNTSTFKRTELILKNYPKYKLAIKLNDRNINKTKKLVSVIDSALKSIEDNEYYSIIEMIYFEKKSREEVAAFYDVDVRTITRQKNKLINEIKSILFSDKNITEILL